MSAYSIQVADDIAPLRTQWRGMDQRAAAQIASGRKLPVEYTFYQTFEWNEFVQRHTAASRSGRLGLKRIEYITAYDGEGNLLAVLPVMVNRLKHTVEMTAWRTAGVNNAAWAGDDFVAAAPLFSGIARLIADRYRGARLRFFDMPPSSPLAQALKALPVGEALHYYERGSYHIPLKDWESFDRYYASLNKKLRHNIRTRSNHFTHGDLEARLRVFTRQTPPPAGYWKKIWRIFFQRKNEWRGRNANFLRRIAGAWSVRRECRSGLKTMSFGALDETVLFAFEINGEPAAFAFLYNRDGHIVVPKLAIDSAQRAHAPGILMLREIMQWCYDNGVRDFDLCRGDEPYKQQMGAVCQPVCRIEGRL